MQSVHGFDKYSTGNITDTPEASNNAGYPCNHKARRQAYKLLSYMVENINHSSFTGGETNNLNISKPY